MMNDVFPLDPLETADSDAAEIPIATNSSLQDNSAISGDRIVWQDWRNGNLDIYMYDLSTGDERQISTDFHNEVNPAISGDRIVWQDFRNGYPDIYMYDLSTGTETQITTNYAQHMCPGISGDRIVWADDRNGWDIYLYDIFTGTETQISYNHAGYAPKISGDRIVWTDYRNGNFDIYLYDISTGTEKRITTNSSEQIYPAIFGDRIVWRDNRNGNFDIYLYKGDGIGDNSDNCPTVYNPTQVVPYWYSDNDYDGYGNMWELEPLEGSCFPPPGPAMHYVTDHTDCNDNDSSVHPGATEIPVNGKDDDCNPATPDIIDSDGDGLNDAAEALYGTNPNDSDSDDDGINDGIEVDMGTNPLNADSDSDGSNDSDDNCPLVFNDQTDTDGDYIGNPCDDDDDNDGFLDGADKCPLNYNPGQEDYDTDGIGDLCDPDADGDGYISVLSGGDDCIDYDPSVNPGAGNCPSGVTPTPEPPADTDGDGNNDSRDNCPTISNPNQENADGDSYGDVCDPCPNDPNNDADSDGICVGAGYRSPKTGGNDNCPTVANTNQANLDGDALGNACDNDADGDTYISVAYGGTDCNDLNDAVKPGVAEKFNNGIDDDCNPSTPDKEYDIVFNMPDYDTWLPTDGAIAPVTATVTGSSICTTPPITFSMMSVTRNVGKYTNDPSQGICSITTSTTCTNNSNCPQGETCLDPVNDFTFTANSNQITITSLDYGGSIKIHAETSAL
jgi:beta propeller repeat protein